MTVVDSLPRVLRLADECPRDPAGDAVRRTACDLVEANSTREGRVRRRRMLKAISRLERSNRRQGAGNDHSGILARKQITDALRDEI